MESARNFLSTPVGKAVGGFFVVVTIGVCIYTATGFFSANEAAASSSKRIFINAQTGEQIPVTLKIGVATPPGAFEAELCYWSKDGKIADKPTYVLTNETQGKPGPTWCPDCDRRVVPLNPPASTATPPPPTKAEFEARRAPQ